MRKAFATAVLNSKFDDLRSKAAQQLSIQFENEILKFTPTFPPSVIKFQRIVGELDEYLKKACPDFPEHVPLESKPAAEVFKNSSYSIDNVQKLSNDIRILKAQPLILRVAAFVYSIQPEAVIVDSGISIILTSLNEENLVRLRSFVDDLMYKAATGVIRPYVRTPGMKSASLIVK
ncbi:hypothetical protein GPJ56_004519 [Histomonas meleagridis]|uniref:uncharacterized protein n=1 Tax=Histomonas meleagridis TaxID=135588 RepID=UPI003559BF06|nr:hypothetical protein GPJ56_004519 [Histomonas meleagridis]KAH0797338.1 hypothetical protein GO595_009841 [Histomonas meleagridis]